ncbi:SxtJ family membrane protein [candidate division KSB1 bacterium]
MNSIIEDIKKIQSSSKDIRKFSLLVGIVSAGLAAVLFWKDSSAYIYFLIFTGILLTFGLITPVLVKPIHKVWMSIAVVLGWFMTRVILSILFYLVVTPIGLIVRLSKKDFMSLTFKTGQDSYWIPKEKDADDKTTFENQF